MANYGPYMAHIWVRYGMVRTSYGAQFCEISSYGKYMGLKAQEKICMVKLWEQVAHRYSIAMAHLLHFPFLWE